MKPEKCRKRAILSLNCPRQKRELWRVDYMTVEAWILDYLTVDLKTGDRGPTDRLMVRKIVFGYKIVSIKVKWHTSGASLTHHPDVTSVMPQALVSTDLAVTPPFEN
ncbi:hypothetical protein J6590_063033 [Homalodisca vitripennis]|nr:hypothetical protein J6590_063033 [Homalodisca vitripennis]